MADIAAFSSFVHYFTRKFRNSKIFCDIHIPDLHTALLKLTAHKDNILIFYLHNLADDFSSHFCNFLQDPVVEAAFRTDRHILYCWDTQVEDLKPQLMKSMKTSLNCDFSDFIKFKKAVALEFRIKNGQPSIFCFYDSDSDLKGLRNVLNTAQQIKLEKEPRGEVPRENEEESSEEEEDEKSEEEAKLHESDLEPKKEKVLTPISYQKMMISNLGDNEYTSFEREQHGELKMKIEFALYGPPTEGNGRKYNDRQQEEIIKLYRQILKENNAFCKWNGRIVMGFIYVCAEALESDKLERAASQIGYNSDSDFVPYPVFILRKCKNKENPTGACRIVIDHEGRVYNSWWKYLTNNRLPPCKMIFPDEGRYYSDKEVILKWKLSPACELSNKIAATSDVAAGVSGLVAGGITIAASSSAVLAAVPLVAAAAPVAAAVGIASGIYAVARSVFNLADREKHKQDTDLSDSESRAAYINIAGGVLSAGMFGAARTASFLAGRGVQLGQGTRYMLYGLNGIGLTVNGIGIGNNIYEAYRAKNVSPLVVAQIGASIFFFANSLYNFKTVANIIEESRSKALSEIEGSLRSNRHRRMFNKLLKESIRTQGESNGKASVIASIRNMENIDEVMTTLTRSNKMLNKQGVRFSAQNGRIFLNGRPVDLTNFGSMSKGNQMSFLGKLPPIPENLTPNVRYIIMQDVKVWINSIDLLYRLTNSQLMIDQLVNEVFSAVKPFLQDFVMDILKQFFHKIDPAVIRMLSNVSTNITIKIVKWVVIMLKNTNVYQRASKCIKVSSKEINSTVDDLVCKFDSFCANFIYDENNHYENKMRRRQKKY